MASRSKRRGNYPKRRPPLGDKHLQAIQMLTDRKTYGNHEDIARRLGISRMTLYRWRQRADFQKALDKAIQMRIRKRFGNRRRDASYLLAAAAVGDAKTVERTLRLIGVI